MSAPRPRRAGPMEIRIFVEDPGMAKEPVPAWMLRRVAPTPPTPMNARHNRSPPTGPHAFRPAAPRDEVRPHVHPLPT